MATKLHVWIDQSGELTRKCCYCKFYHDGLCVYSSRVYFGSLMGLGFIGALDWLWYSRSLFNFDVLFYSINFRLGKDCRISSLERRRRWCIDWSRNQGWRWNLIRISMKIHKCINGILKKKSTRFICTPIKELMIYFKTVFNKNQYLKLKIVEKFKAQMM